MKNELFLTIIISILKIFPSHSQEQLNPNNDKRLALVIGNNDYIFGSKLKNAVNDAALISKCLEELNFEVIMGKNLNKKSFEDSIRSFFRKKSDYDIILFFYAGHGIQVDGENYLIPIDAKLEVKEDVKFETIEVDFITELLEEKSSTNIIILDACRNNPFKTFDRGVIIDFERPEKLSSGSIIAYGTKENSTASDGADSNGLYSKCLAEQLIVKQSLSDVFINTRASVLKESNFTQCPQEWSMLTEQVYLNKDSQIINRAEMLKKGEYTLYRFEDSTSHFPVTQFRIDSIEICHADFLSFNITGIGQNWHGKGATYSNIGFYKWRFENGESGTTRFKFNSNSVIDGEVIFDSNPYKNWKFTAIPNE
jgi:hypothetical protein